VRSEVADVPNGVETLVNVAGEFARRDDLINLVVEVLLLCSELVLEYRLQAPPAE